MRTRLNRLNARILIHSFLLRNLPRLLKDIPPWERVQLKTTRMLLNTYRRSSLSVLCGFLVPSELLHLYGASPISTEFLAPMLAVTDRAQRALDITEAKGFSRDTCSFHRAALGSALDGYLPSYDVIVATSHLCDGQNKTLEEMARRLGSRYYLLDVPQERTPEAIDYLATQLRELEDGLAELRGGRAGLSDWERVLGLSNETREMMIRVSEMRKHPGCPLHGKTAFNMGLLSLLMMGTPFLRDCYLDLLRDLESGHGWDPDSERYRILWLLAYPYFNGNFLPAMERQLGIRAVADELSRVHWDPLDPEAPHRSLARRMLSNPNLGPVQGRVDLVRQLVSEHQPDGVLHFSHWGCRQGCGGVRPIADELHRMGVPFLELHGDCIDGRQESEGQSWTRLEGFAELMQQLKKGGGLRASGIDGYYLGMDVGSTTAKAVLVDSSGRIVHREVLATGASTRRCAEKLRAGVLDAIPGHGSLRCCIATGYGRGGVWFADRTVTEITCHARGMSAQLPGVRSIIDIGGQDTKAIAVDARGSVTKFVMNDKCAAGTGRFLEMMARTLETDIDRLGEMASRATRGASISSMCTVFAESEVISLIAEETPADVIARGICTSIASRTVSMLDRVGRERDIAMSGGVARNTGVIKELQRLLGIRLVIPEEPQLMGALGAALIGADQEGSDVSAT
jgi:predicted CoA-substrate-specific enzyme activase